MLFIIHALGEVLHPGSISVLSGTGPRTGHPVIVASHIDFLLNSSHIYLPVPDMHFFG